MSKNTTESRCPFKVEDQDRREHWIAIFRIWREEKLKDGQ